MYEEVFGKFVKISGKYYPVMAVYNFVMLNNRSLLKITRLIYCDEHRIFHSRDLVDEFYGLRDMPSAVIAMSLCNSYLDKTSDGFVIKEKLIDKCHDYLVDKVESDTFMLLGACRAYKWRFGKYPEYERTLKLVKGDYNNMDFRVINMISRKDEFK